MRMYLKDFETVHNFLSRTDLAGDISDDYAPDMFVVAKNLLSTSIVLMPSDQTMYVITPLNSVLYNVHLITTKDGKADLLESSLRAAYWAKENTLMQTLIAFIPDIYGSTIHFAEKAGMNRVGVVPSCFAKNEKLLDTVVLSTGLAQLIKEFEKWHQQ